MGNIVEQVKDKLTMEFLLDHYGLKMNETRKVCCTVNSEKTPSCHIKDNVSFCCYSCGAHGDVIDFISHEEQCDFDTALKIGIGLAGLGGTNLTTQELEQIEQRKLQKEKEKQEISEKLAEVVKVNQAKARSYILTCTKRIGQTDYFTNRGISIEMQHRFDLGYEPKNNTVIIPYNADLHYFCTRSIADKKFWKPNASFRCKPNGEYDFESTSWILGTEPIFNEEVLYQDGIVMVVESQIDAISLEQAGMRACAIGGTHGGAKLEKVRNKIKAYMVFGFDNDEAGAKATAEMKEKWLCGVASPLPQYKDWNEWLVTNPADFMRQVGNVARMWYK